METGQVVTYKPPKNVPLIQLRDAIMNAGFDASIVRDMLPKNALKRAFRSMRKGRVIKEVNSSGGNTHFQFTKEHLDSMGKEILYDKEAVVTIDSQGFVFATDPVIEVEAKRLLNEHLGKRLGSDVNVLVHRIFDQHKADLIPIREEGGAYIVPDKHADLVAKIQQMFNDINGRVRCWSISMGDDDSKESTADSLSDYLNNLITEFRQTCQDLDHESKEFVQNRRFEAIKELKEKLQCYRGLLTGYAGSIDRELQAAEQELLAKLAKQPAVTQKELIEV